MAVIPCCLALLSIYKNITLAYKVSRVVTVSVGSLTLIVICLGVLSTSISHSRLYELSTAIKHISSMNSSEQSKHFCFYLPH